MRVGRRLLGILLLCALSAPGWADQRTQNIDVMIALDKSLSMEDKVGSVERWVDSSIIDQMLIPGDYFTVIAFYGKADVVISQALASDADKAGLKKAIDAIHGNGRFTDIGNALDVLKSQLASRSSDGREKYVLLLTDGIQEAPPTSKYYSKNGTFNHEFLDNTKTIPEKGWKIMILGVGTAGAAKELAGQLQGAYAPVGNKPTEQSLSEGSNALFSTVTMQGDATLSAVNSGGRSTLSFTLKASGLKGKTLITLGGISALIGPNSLPNLLPQPFSFSLPGRRRAAGPRSRAVPQSDAAGEVEGFPYVLLLHARAVHADTSFRGPYGEYVGTGQPLRGRWRSARPAPPDCGRRFPRAKACPRTAAGLPGARGR